MRKIVLYIAAAALIAGCQTNPGETGLSGEAEITFDVTLPPQPTANTRATYTDTDVENIDVLVFDHQAKFIERISIDHIAGTGAQKSFSIRMNYTNQPRTFHIVANGRDPVDDTDKVNFADVLSVGKSESEAIPQLRTLQRSFVSEATITPLVMWGRAQVASVDQPVIPITGTKLLRSQAAVVVRKADPTAENGLSRLNVTSVSLHNAPVLGNVAPLSYTSSASVPNAPNVPAGVQTVNYRPGYTPGGTEPVMYVYEHENTPADPVSVIIEAKYDGSAVSSYYRFLLIDQNGQYVKLIRNHRYIVTIVHAEGKGYFTEQEALDAPPTNLRVEIIDEFDTNFVIVANGENEIGVSVNHIEFWGGHSSLQHELITCYVSTGNQPTVTLNHTAFDAGGVSRCSDNLRWTASGWWRRDNKATGWIDISDVSKTGEKHSILQRVTLITKDLPQSTASANHDTWVWKLFDESNKPWSVRIVENPTRARLSTSPAAASFSTPWGSSSMASHQSPFVHLHVQWAGAPVVLDYECMHQGSLRIGRLIIGAK